MRLQTSHELVQRVPHGLQVPTNLSPAVVHQLPPVIHELYVAAVAAALHPVFLTAAGVMAVAFGLSWLLRDVPLRETAGMAEAGPQHQLERVPAPSAIATSM